MIVAAISSRRTERSWSCSLMRVPGRGLATLERDAEPGAVAFVTQVEWMSTVSSARACSQCREASSPYRSPLDTAAYPKILVLVFLGERP
jgi:hypothetical protein